MFKEIYSRRMDSKKVTWDLNKEKILIMGIDYY